jgi:hypothetical protein
MARRGPTRLTTTPCAHLSFVRPLPRLPLDASVRDEAGFVAVDHGLHPVAQIELLEDASDATEGAVVPLLIAMTVTKVADFTLAVAGIALAAAVLVTRRRSSTSRSIA